MKKYFYLIFFLSLFPISVKAIDLNTIVDTVINQLSNTNPQSTKEIAQLNQTEITEMVKAVTVKVSANNNRGTGTIIGKEGNKYLIITNFHVIRGNNNITIETADGDTHQAQLIENGISNKYDLALLEFTSENQYQKVEISPLLPKSLDLKIPIIAGGYADETRQLKVTRGEIKQIADKPLKDGYEIGYSGEIVQGMSGGGIFWLYEVEGVPEATQLLLIGINGRSSHPIINTGYVYEDGDKPSTAEIAKMREVNWGIAINTLLIHIKSEILTVYKLPLPEVAPDIQITTTGYIAELEAKAKQFTVRIDSSSKKNGSGVIIAKEGKTYTVLTADHVLCEKSKNATDKDPCLDYSYTIITHDGKIKEINKSTIIREKGVDLAVFKFESEESYPVAEIADYNPNTNDFVFAAGFPKVGNNDTQWLFSGGRINDKEQGLLQTRQSDLSNQQGGILQSVASLTGGYELVYTSITYGGMSGGALLDSQGRVIGIHGKSEGAGVEKIQLGYSLGIPISTFVGLQDRLKVKAQLLTTAKPQVSQSQQEEIIKFINSVIVADTHAKADIWIERGSQWWRLGKYEKAVDAFDEAIKQNKPENVYLAWYGKGLALSGGGQYQLAIDALEQAINTFPDAKTLSDKEKENLQAFHSNLLRMQSVAYQYLEDYEKALTAINQAITLSSNNPNGYNNKWALLSDLNRYDEALTAINQAIDLAPRAAWYLNRGFLYYKQQKWDLAESDYNKAIELNPNHANAYNNRGILYGDLQKWDLAESNYTKAIELNPNDVLAYYNRGILYYKQQQLAIALSDFNKAIELEPNFERAYINRGILYYKQQQLALAESDFNKAIELNLNDAYAYMNRGVLYLNQQQWELALSDFTKAVELNPKLANAYYNRGLVYAELKQTEKAKTDLQKAAELFKQQGNMAAYEKVMQILQQLGG